MSAADLRTAMRKLWEEHVQWTRTVIISFAAGLPDFDAAFARLLRNQDDIGSAVKPYYGEAAGNQLARLLREHIMISADVLKAAKSGDQTAISAANQRWYVNGEQIADFLSAANPTNWPPATMRPMLKTHLDTTLAEAGARLKVQWQQDVAAYEAAREHVLMMADALTSGIAAQFPERFLR
jgi:hypothetical protein